MLINISPEAYDYIKNANKTDFFLVQIIKGGCFGMQYKFSYVKEVPEKCEKFEFNDLVVFVPLSSLLFVAGSQLILQKNSTGLRLCFQNPNVKKECGCNKSFLV